MKALITFLFIVLMQYEGIAQQHISLNDAERIANVLVEKSFLTQKGKTILLRDLTAEKIEVDIRSTVYPVSHTSTAITKESILEFCLSALITEAGSRVGYKNNIEEEIKDPEPLIDSVIVFHSFDFMGGNKDYRDVISKQTSTMGLTRNKTFQTFKESGLLCILVESEVRKALEHNIIKTERDLARYCLERSVYYSWYAFNKEEQHKFMGELQAAGIISQRGKDSLVASYRTYELKTITDILSANSHFRLVSFDDSVVLPSQTYPVIFDRIQQLVPEFKYENLRTEIVEYKDFSLIRQDVRIHFTVDEIPYMYDVFYDYKNPDSTLDKKIEPDPFQENFQKPVNKWLTDIGSPYRLYVVMDGQNRKSERPYIGLILLKEGQAGLISEDPNILSSESFDTKLSRKNVIHLQQQLEEHGFFTHMSNGVKDSVKKRMLVATPSSFIELLSLIPSTVVAFDGEMVNLDNPYEELTLLFSAATRGACTVTRIIDGYSKAKMNSKTIPYGFNMNGKNYQTKLVYDRDWIDLQFVDLFQKALIENNVDGKFYECVSGEDFGGYIFFTRAQYQFIRSNYPTLLGRQSPKWGN